MQFLNYLKKILLKSIDFLRFNATNNQPSRLKIIPFQKARIAQGISVQIASQFMRIPTQTIEKIERGDYKNLDLKPDFVYRILWAYAEFLRMPKEEIKKHWPTLTEEPSSFPELKAHQTTYQHIYPSTKPTLQHLVLCGCAIFCLWWLGILFLPQTFSHIVRTKNLNNWIYLMTTHLDEKEALLKQKKILATQNVSDDKA